MLLTLTKGDNIDKNKPANLIVVSQERRIHDYTQESTFSRYIFGIAFDNFK